MNFERRPFVRRPVKYTIQRTALFVMALGSASYEFFESVEAQNTGRMVVYGLLAAAAVKPSYDGLSQLHPFNRNS